MMPTLPTGTSTKQSGFSLVELMVVIVVLALVGTITLPLLANRDEAAEKKKLRRIAGTVKQLYNEATLTRNEYLLTFDLDNNSLETYRLVSGAGKIEKEAFGRRLEMAPLRVRQVDVKGQGSFRTGRVSVKIYPLGWMDATEVDFERGDGRDVEMVFSPLTGATTINEEGSRL